MAAPFDQAYDSREEMVILSVTMQFCKAMYAITTSDQTQIETSVLDVIVVANIPVESMRQRVQGELDAVFIYTRVSLVLKIQMESGI
jgi:hypothetical protein